jgi:hypothetical protein
MMKHLIALFLFLNSIVLIAGTDPGKLLYTKYKWNNKQWDTLELKYQKIDANGDLIVNSTYKNIYLYYSWMVNTKNNVPQLVGIDSFEYNSGKLMRHSFSDYFSLFISFSFVKTYHYNNNGFLDSVYNNSPGMAGCGGSGISWFNYFYQGRGILSQVDNYYDYYYSSSDSVFYDINGKLIREYKGSEGGTDIQYQYNAFDSISAISYDANWYTDKEVLYYYNEANRKSVEIVKVKDANGNFENSELKKFYYSRFGKLDSVIHYLADQYGHWIKNEKTVFNHSFNSFSSSKKYFENMGVKEMELKIYPNPVAHDLYISNLEQSSDTKIELLDLSGKIQACQYRKEENQIVIDLRSQKTGTYILILSNSEFRHKEKIQIVR